MSDGVAIDKFLSATWFNTVKIAFFKLISSDSIKFFEMANLLAGWTSVIFLKPLPYTR